MIMFDEIIFDANTKGTNLRSIIRNSCPILRPDFPSRVWSWGFFEVGPRNLRNERPPLCCWCCGCSSYLCYRGNTDEKCSDDGVGRMWVLKALTSIKPWPWKTHGPIIYLWEVSHNIAGQYLKCRPPIMYSSQWRHVRVRGFNKLIHISVRSHQHKHRSGLGWSFTVMLVLNTGLHHHLTMSGILSFPHYVLHLFCQWAFIVESVHIHQELSLELQQTLFELLLLLLSFTIFASFSG